MATATMDTAQIVDFALGTKRLQADSVPAEAWLEIIRGVVDLLPAGPSCLQSIQQVLHFDPGSGSNSIPHRVTKKIPGELPYAIGKSIRSNEVFFSCYDTDEFPRTWEEAPRHELQIQDFPKLRSVESEHLLLLKKRRFFWLRARWVPKEDWDESDHMATRPDFSYELDVTPLSYVLSDDYGLRELCEEDLLRNLRASRKIAETMLHRIMLAISTRLDVVEDQRKALVEDHRQIQDILRRVSLW